MSDSCTTELWTYKMIYVCMYVCMYVHPYLITQVIFGEEYCLWSSSLCCLLCSPVISSLLGPNIFLSVLLPDILNLSLMKLQFVIVHTISQNWDSFITRQMGYQHTLCQNAVSTKYRMSLHFCKNITCSGVGLLKIGQVFFVSCKIVYLWVMTNCFFRSTTFLPRSERPSFTYI